MAPKVHYVSILVHNPSDPNQIRARLEWLCPLIRTRLPLTLFIDTTYYDALQNSVWFSEGIYPEVRLIPWSLDDSETWGMCLAYSPMGPLRLPDIRNGPKDTEFFLALMNAKTELVARVAEEVETPYVAFLDAGITKIFQDVEGSLQRLKKLEIREDFSGVLIPGCWQPAAMEAEELARKICWMYCGGFFLVGRKEAGEFARCARAALREFLEMGRLTWEVNVWVRLQEYPGCPQLHWFSADHNDRMTMVPGEFLAGQKSE